MRIIDHLRLNPICFDGATDRFDFNASKYVEDATAFDISEVADQIIESETETFGVGSSSTLTAKGHELIKTRPHPTDPNSYTLDLDQYIGIIPPFPNCFYEYTVHNYTYEDKTGTKRCFPLTHGIQVTSMPESWIPIAIPDYKERGIKYAFEATVYTRMRIGDQYYVERKSIASIASAVDGTPLVCNVHALLPPSVDRTLRQNQPQRTPIVVMLIAVMMLNCGMLKSTLTEPSPQTRQQRRYEERHPQRATPPPVRFYTLEIDLDKTGTGASGSGKEGGWEQAWHLVRGHMRQLKSGKIVAVRPHARGNPLKGVIRKEYKIKANHGTAA